ncbi:MAG: AI-2E family transporter [Planctomycetota bacterium]|jgi:predicted PurR-regulated permease PerM|nr:AI-2E family transporter [Planctomycetota bacterium]MDP6939575.1 AI-2E family transporter [Planctomycetota bacterium]
MPSANRALTFLLGIIATILVGWVVHTGSAILKPLVIALLLASMLQPVVIGLKRRGIPPPVTIILMVWLLFLGIVQVGLLFNANVQKFLESGSDAASVTTTEATESPALDPMAGRLELLPGQSQEDLIGETGGWVDIVDKIETRLTSSGMAESVVRYAAKALRELPVDRMAGDLAIGGFGFVANVVLVLIYMVFIFAEQAVFRRKILSIAGERHDDAERVLNTIGRGIQRYLGVKTVVSLLTGSLCYLVMVALDIPYALFFGFLTFMFNYIPTFGSIIAGSLPTMTALAVEASWTKAAAIMGTYLAVNLTLGSFIEPRILGRELNLSPLVVVVSVVVWAGLWGVVGGFLAVPLTASLQICLASQESTRPLAVMLGSGPPREKKKSPGQAKGPEAA